MSFDRETDKFRTFGRAKGRPLSPHMQTIWNSAFPDLKWDMTAPLPAGELWLEIGFGGSEHLLWQAEHHPDIHLVGAEPFMNGVAKAVRGAHDGDLTNLSLHHGDVRDLLSALPGNSLSKIFILAKMGAGGNLPINRIQTGGNAGRIGPEPAMRPKPDAKAGLAIILNSSKQTANRIDYATQ